MALTKQQKQNLFASYVDLLKNSQTTIAISQSKIPVKVASLLRMRVRATWGQFVVVNKKILLKAAKDAWLEDVDLSFFSGSIGIVVAWEDQLSPMKVFSAFVKDVKRNLWDHQIEFMWWRQDGKWLEKWYVVELANLPSKSELISKLLYLLKHPIKSLAYTLAQVSEKKE